MGQIYLFRNEPVIIWIQPHTGQQRPQWESHRCHIASPTRTAPPVPAPAATAQATATNTATTPAATLPATTAAACRTARTATPGEDKGELSFAFQ